MDETILSFIDAWDEVASQMLDSSREILQPGLTPDERADRIRSESFVLSLRREEGSACQNPETGNFEYVVHRVGALGLAERIRDWCFQQQCPIACGALFDFQSIVHELIEGYARTPTRISERTREIELHAIEDLFARCDRVLQDVEAFARVRADDSRGSGIVRADDLEILKKKPSDPLVRELGSELRRQRGNGKSEMQIALEVTHDDKKRAKSLLRTLRKPEFKWLKE